MIDAEIKQTKVKKPLVVIDEIQKIPLLLDEVHRLIEERGFRFLLTGSSARKLKLENANLLGSRAWNAQLFPPTSFEISIHSFDLDRYLRYGGLPSVWLSEDPEELLEAYVQSYLSEEIKSEAVVRKIPAFVEFLRIAALSNGSLINYACLARDSRGYLNGNSNISLAEAHLEKSHCDFEVLFF